MLNENIWMLSLFMVILLTSCTIPFLKKELNETFVPGLYPSSVDNPLLVDSYKVKKKPGVDPYSGAAQIWKNYPQFPADHIGTNNIKYWRRPTNGRCTPADMCNGIYEPTEQNIPSPPIPPPVIPQPGESRINFYTSS